MSPMHPCAWPHRARRLAATLAVCTIPLACDPVEDDVDEAELVAAVEPDGAEILPLRASSEERPCGDRTVAHVRHESGVDVTFCELAEGVIAIGESGAEGTSSVLERLHDEPARVCPADLFRAVAPGQAVPVALERACAGSDELLRAPELASAAASLDRSEALVIEDDPQALLGNYCGAAGPNNFWVDHCQGFMESDLGDPSSFYCIHNALWGWHDRTMSVQLGGEEGDWGEESVAACGGSIRFRAMWRWDVGDAWVTDLDVTVGAGGWYHWVIAEIHGGEDIDVRFKVDSLGGTHRHGGLFEDW